MEINFGLLLLLSSNHSCHQGCVCSLMTLNMSVTNTQTTTDSWATSLTWEAIREKQFQFEQHSTLFQCKPHNHLDLHLNKCESISPLDAFCSSEKVDFEKSSMYFQILPIFPIFSVWKEKAQPFFINWTSRLWHSQSDRSHRMRGRLGVRIQLHC